MRRHSVTLGGALLVLSLAAGCGIQGGNPQEVYQQAVSGLAGREQLAFTGQTQLSIGGLPPTSGVAFRGTVSGRDQLLMQVVPGGADSLQAGTEPAGRSRKTQPAAVQLSRSQEEWIVADPAGSGEAGQLVRWNPLSQLERLNAMNKEIVRDTSAEVPGMTVLSVTPDTGEVTAQMRADLEAELQSLTADRKLQELQSQLQLTAKQVAAMRREVEASLASARAQIQEMKDSVQAESVYRIGVTRKTNLPGTMQVSTKLRYMRGGKPKEETTEVAYTFQES